MANTERKTTYLGIAVALGIMAGAVIGSLMDDVRLGVTYGVVAGAVVGGALFMR